MQAELVERAKGGDKDAFASLVSSSIDGCYALAYRILRDPHRAQDATQQALLGAWRDLPTLRDSERSTPGFIASSSMPATPKPAANAATWPASGCSRPTFPPRRTWRAPSPRETTSTTPSASCHRNSGRSSSSITTSGIR